MRRNLNNFDVIFCSPALARENPSAMGKRSTVVYMGHDLKFPRLKRSTSSPIPRVSRPSNVSRVAHVTAEHNVTLNDEHKLPDGMKRELDVLKATCNHLPPKLTRSPSVDIERFRADHAESDAMTANRRKSKLQIMRRFSSLGRLGSYNYSNDRIGSSVRSNAVDEGAPSGRMLISDITAEDFRTVEHLRDLRPRRDSAQEEVDEVSRKILLRKAAKQYARKIRNQE